MIVTLLLLQQILVPDSARLQRLADSIDVKYAAVAALAHEESVENLDPALRGHHCWWSARADSIPANVDVNGHERPWLSKRGVLYLIHHEPNCEVGRFQIKPSTAKGRCPGLNIWLYDGNLACFAIMFAEDVRKKDVFYAITHHNGSGPKAREYLQRVLSTVGRITLTTENQNVRIGNAHRRSEVANEARRE